MSSNGNAMNDDINHLGADENPVAAMHKIRTAGSISISPELFEKLYLNPKQPVKGGLQRMIGNPTPIALMGFLMSLTPLSCDLMGWRGSGGNGAANIGAFFFFGGILMIVGGFCEFLLANTFSGCVFMSFGSLYMSYAATYQQFYTAFSSYSPNPDDPRAGLDTIGFNASYGFFWVFFTVLCFVFLVASVRTNLVFVFILFTIVLGLGLVTGAFWNVALGNMEIASRCQVGGGACLFAACLGGWYLLSALLFIATDLPFSLPVGDLSRHIPAGSSRAPKGDKV